MASCNVIILMGNLTKDVELKYTTNGTPVCSFGLAVNRTYTDADGEKQEDTTFIDIVCWNKLAENCAQYLHKGSPAFVEDRLKQNSWETDDGSRRYRHEVVARSVQFLGGKPSDEAETQADDVPF